MDTTLWEDLLNSDWHDYRGSGRREDRIDDPVWLERFIAPWHAWLDRVPAAEVQAALKNLRRVLRCIVDGIASGGSGAAWAAGGTAAGRTAARGALAAATAELDALLGASPFVRRLEQTGAGGFALMLAPVAPGLEAMITAIASSFAATLAEGEPTRIKVCGNRDCLWVFYDRSKNRSRLWCEGNTGCGNLMKVRRFREKAREAKNGQGARKRHGGHEATAGQARRKTPGPEDSGASAGRGPAVRRGAHGRPKREEERSGRARTHAGRSEARTGLGRTRPAPSRDDGPRPRRHPRRRPPGER
jgi:predicted RNA-binding Zn ribbon-like protein